MGYDVELTESAADTLDEMWARDAASAEVIEGILDELEATGTARRERAYLVQSATVARMATRPTHNGLAAVIWHRNGRQVVVHAVRVREAP